MAVKCIGVRCIACNTVILHKDLGHGYMTYCKCKQDYIAVDRVTGNDSMHRYVGKLENIRYIYLIDGETIELRE